MNANISQEEIHTLYKDLNNLLEDICEFLSEEVKNGNIKKLNAEELIGRSKKHLQTIARVAPQAVDDDASYVDMSSKTKQTDDEVEYYDPTDSEEDNKDATCPYIDKPIQDFMEKSGYLEKKERMLIFERSKKYYAGIYKRWMLLYNCENDTKASKTFDLKKFQAKPAEATTKKVSESFDLLEWKGTRSFHFTATTTKDMMQWVTVINKKSSKPDESFRNVLDEPGKEVPNMSIRKLKPLPSIPSNQPMKPLLSVPSDDNIYYQIATHQTTNTVKRTSDDDDNSEHYEELQTGLNTQRSEDDDEENIYNELLPSSYNHRQSSAPNVRNTPTANSNVNEDIEDDTYDELMILNNDKDKGTVLQAATNENDEEAEYDVVLIDTSNPPPVISARKSGTMEKPKVPEKKESLKMRTPSKKISALSQHLAMKLKS